MTNVYPFCSVALALSLAALPTMASAQDQTPPEDPAQVTPSQEKDNCANVANNERWNSLQLTLKEQLEKEQYDNALNTANELSSICDAVPTLNYITGNIYQKQKDKESARKYYKKAIDNPYGFVLPKEYLEKFYLAYFQVSEGNYTQEEVDKLLAEKDEQIALNNSSSSDNLKIAKTVMWTGTGIGIAGVVVTVLGAIEYWTKVFDGDPVWDENKGGPDKTPTKYTIGGTLLGAGIGLTVVGAVMAGIGGYYYTHSDSSIALSDSVSFTYDVGLNNLQLGLTF